MQSEDSPWIVAPADESNENHSDWSCTLFEADYVNGQDATEGVRFRCVQNNHYVCLWPTAGPGPHNSCLYAGSKSPDSELCAVCTIIDLDTMLVLAKHVAFKGNNGKYLTAAFQEGHNYLQFSSDEVRAPDVGNEVFITDNGFDRIKSDYYGGIWRRVPNRNWIWADYTDSPPIDDTKFWSIGCEDIYNKVALRSLGNKKFCKRLTEGVIVDCLNAGASTIVPEAILEVSETVVSRKIDNAVYTLTDSRIYKQKTIIFATQDIVNDSQEAIIMELNFSYTDTKTSIWNASVSLKLAAEIITFEAGIPRIIDGNHVEISGEFKGTYTWGETVKTTLTQKTKYWVTVPARTKVTVSLLATQGSCDVPFSYTQHDTHTNGQEVPYVEVEDGLYTGTNYYNIRYETEEEPLAM